MKRDIQLKQIADAQRFVRVTNQFAFPIDVQAGRHIVDGKSIIGLFSLDLSRPLTVSVSDEYDSAELFEALKEFD